MTAARLIGAAIALAAAAGLAAFVAALVIAAPHWPALAALSALALAVPAAAFSKALADRLREGRRDRRHHGGA